MADLKGSSVGAWWVPRYRLSWLRPDLILLIDGSGLFIFEFGGHQALREMVADLRSEGLEIWGVLPLGSAEDAVMRFRRIFGPEEVQLFASAADAVATHLDQLGGPTDSG